MKPLLLLLVLCLWAVTTVQAQQNTAQAQQDAAQTQQNSERAQQNFEQAQQQQQPLSLTNVEPLDSQQIDPNRLRPTDPGASVAATVVPESTGIKTSRVNGVIEIEDTIRIKREQPKVLSIVPWQPPRDKASLPSPFVKRIQQDFMPLDRDEFTRKVEHFERVAGSEQK